MIITERTSASAGYISEMVDMRISVEVSLSGVYSTNVKRWISKEAIE